MGTETAAPTGDRPPTDAADAALQRYADITTHEGELLVYDVDEEDAWIQADLYYSRDALV